MTRQEKIREGLISKIKSIRNWARRDDDPLPPEDDADDILNYLRWFDDSGVEPLIEESR